MRDWLNSLDARGVPSVDLQVVVHCSSTEYAELESCGHEFAAARFIVYDTLLSADYDEGGYDLDCFFARGRVPPPFDDPSPASWSPEADLGWAADSDTVRSW